MRNGAQEMTKKSKGRYLVAVDPDVRRHGVAAFDRFLGKWIAHKPMDPAELLNFVTNLDNDISNIDIVVEASWWITKSNFRGGNYRTAQKKAASVGLNQGAGMAIVSLLTGSGFSVTEIKPLSKGKGLLKNSQTGQWTPTGRKFISDESGITSRINDDVRDAIFIALTYR